MQSAGTGGDRSLPTPLPALPLAMAATSATLPIMCSDLAVRRSRLAVKWRYGVPARTSITSAGRLMANASRPERSSMPRATRRARSRSMRGGRPRDRVGEEDMRLIVAQLMNSVH